MKTRINMWWLTICIIVVCILSPGLHAQSPPLPLNIAKCQDFFGNVKCGNCDVIKQCISMHPEYVNKQNNNGQTPLMVAAFAGQSRMVSYLIRKGANIDACDLNGMQALHYACESGNLAIVKQLVSKGAAIDIKTKSGVTPLCFAALSANMELFLYIEKQRADIYKNDQNQVILWAARGGNIELFKYLEQKKFDPQTIDSAGDGALHWAATGSGVEMCKYLVKVKGFDIRQKNRSGKYPVELAIDFSQFENTRFFLENGIQINEQNASGGSWLHNAAKSGSILIADYLLKNGCDINSTDKQGNTPLKEAIMAGHFHLVNLFMELGAQAKESDDIIDSEVLDL